MTDSVSIQTQLEELSVEISGRVAEMLAIASKNLPPEVQQRVVDMIENNVPTVITNTLFKTTVLHSAKGIDHLKNNLDSYCESFARQFLNQDT